MKRSGFTLIELLVVISIIGILAALFLANMVGVRERSRDAATKSNLTQLQNALRLYYNDNQRFPTTDTDCATLITNLRAPVNYIQDITIDAQGSCTYDVSTDYESYVIDVDIFSAAGTSDTASGEKCGISSPQEGHYYVCAN